MEIKLNNKKWKWREEGPTQNQIWGILKYLSAEFFAEKSKTDQGSRTRVCNILGQKLGYDITSRGINCRNENEDVINRNGKGNLLVIYINNIGKNISRTNAPKIW
jgi:hypothetical protein